MTIPSSGNYPLEFDTNANLYEVHDSSRVKLAEDYSPGDTSIAVTGEAAIMAKFPATGLITLTDQISDIDYRAISFYYSSKTDTEFSGLELLSGFTDVYKPKNITHVTQNVMAAHHDNLKNSIVSIEKFIGIKDTEYTMPGGETLEGRINFLRRLVLTPRAWFTTDKVTGLVPLTIKFTDQSFRLGNGEISYIWDFGDQTISNVLSMSQISVASVVPSTEINVTVRDTDGGSIKKTYDRPGKYTVKLTVINEHGQDEVEVQEVINARIAAPAEAQIEFLDRSNQITTDGEEIPTFDRLATRPAGPYEIPPTIRTSTNSLIDIEVPYGHMISSSTSYAGEYLDDTNQPIDPIVQYTWKLGDELNHSNSRTARASYSIGGIYDLKLRVDTQYGAYRITTYENCIDIIEKNNLWLWNIDGTSTIKAHEFGLISETFKTATREYAVAKDDSFLDGTANETQGKREFLKNNAFIPVGSNSSGSKGLALIAWSGGGSPLSAQQINTIEYEGFGDTYNTTSLSITRPWNWVALSNGSIGYFLFGPDQNMVPNTNYVCQRKTTIDLTAGYTISETNFSVSNYKNGAIELQESPTSTYTSGEPDNGRFAVYRSAWKGQNGYILRNDGTGEFFRIKSFYKTEGIVGAPVEDIYKLTDMAGSTKIEGQLVSLSSGLFFFNNSGGISAYNDVTNTWETGGPSSSSASFRSLQDESVAGFDDAGNTLLAASDGDRVVYLSYDYSSNAFMKFNLTDLTFTAVMSRPQENNTEQWLMGIY